MTSTPAPPPPPPPAASPVTATLKLRVVVLPASSVRRSATVRIPGDANACVDWAPAPSCAVAEVPERAGDGRRRDRRDRRTPAPARSPSRYVGGVDRRRGVPVLQRAGVGTRDAVGVAVDDPSTVDIVVARIRLRVAIDGCRGAAQANVAAARSTSRGSTCALPSSVERPPGSAPRRRRRATLSQTLSRIVIGKARSSRPTCRGGCRACSPRGRRSCRSASPADVDGMEVERRSPCRRRSAVDHGDVVERDRAVAALDTDARSEPIVSSTLADTRRSTPRVDSAASRRGDACDSRELPAAALSPTTAPIRDVADDGQSWTRRTSPLYERQPRDRRCPSRRTSSSVRSPSARMPCPPNGRRPTGRSRGRRAASHRPRCRADCRRRARQPRRRCRSSVILLAASAPSCRRAREHRRGDADALDRDGVARLEGGSRGRRTGPTSGAPGLPEQDRVGADAVSPAHVQRGRARSRLGRRTRSPRARDADGRPRRRRRGGDRRNGRRREGRRGGVVGVEVMPLIDAEGHAGLRRASRHPVAENRPPCAARAGRSSSCAPRRGRRRGAACACARTSTRAGSRRTRRRRRGPGSPGR